jgi:hypothetical protein
VASKLVKEKTLGVFETSFSTFFNADGNSAVNQSLACINLGAKNIFSAYATGCMP